jgi:hypothetical protein
VPEAHGNDVATARDSGIWILTAPLSKGWNARRPATRTTAEHPGRAISWDGALFEVLDVEILGAGVRYTLAPWEDRHTIRVIEPYDEASELRRAADRVDDHRRRERKRLILLLAPLSGHAPGDVQDKWEREYDVPASFLTLISAIPLFLFGVLCALALTIRGFTGVALLPFSSGVLLFGLYLLVESGFRLSAAWGSGRPAGSLVGALVYGIWERVRRAKGSAAGRSGPPL